MKRGLKRALSVLISAAMIFCSNSSYAFAGEISLEEISNEVISNEVISNEVISNEVIESQEDIEIVDADECIEEIQEEEIQEELAADADTIILRVEFSAPQGCYPWLNNPDWNQIESESQLNTNEDFYFNAGGGVPTKVEYTVGSSTERIELIETEYRLPDSQNPGCFFYFTGYKIPKENLTGDIKLYVEVREYYSVKSISFAEALEKGFSVQYKLHYDSDDWVDAEGGIVPGDELLESHQIYIRFIPNPATSGNKIANVSVSQGKIAKDSSDGTYYMDLVNLESENAEIIATVDAYDGAKQEVSIIHFRPKQVDIQVRDAEGNTVEPYLPSEQYLGEYLNWGYKLDNGKKYTLNINTINGCLLHGIVTNGKENYFDSPKEQYTIKDFKGNQTIDIVSGAVYYPFVLVNGEPAKFGDKKYLLNYYDTATFGYKVSDETHYADKLVVKLGSQVIKEVNSDTILFKELSEVYGKFVTVDMYDEEGSITVFPVQLSNPISSITLKNKAVLNPISGGHELESAVTLNSGAEFDSLGYKFVNADNEEITPNFVYANLENGKLYIGASPVHLAPVGTTVDIVFYDKKSTVPWNEQVISGNRYTIIFAKPTWASKTPTATLTSASDVALTFKVGAPSGESFVGGNYYVGVGLTTNNNTAKGLKKGLVINDAHEEFFKINEDGTIPEITINPFRVGNMDGEKVTKLGDGCGTSMNAIFYIVMTDGDVPNGGNTLATTDVKKCKTITAATKAPYYADKITLKKVSTNLYDGDQNVIVATVDFGKNATYTTKDCWKIANKEELEENGISAVQDGDNKVKVSVGDGVPAGKYTINAETVAESEKGVPAKASITVTVLPTASDVTADPVTIYRKPNSKVSYKVTSTVTDQGGAVIKNAAYTYEIGSGDKSPLDPVSGLTVNKGTINVDKSVPAGEYQLKITAKCGREVSSELIPVQIVEDKIDLAKFVFSNPGGATIADEMTLAKYNDLGWDKSNIARASAIMSINDIAGSGLQLRDSNNGVVTWNLIKSVKIPNPLYINKAGKITLSAEAIDGTKLSRTINIVSNTTSSAENFSKLHLKVKGSADSEYVMENGAFDVSGESTGTVYSLWLSELDNNAVNSLTDISGNKLTLKGAKIIDNYHNDYLTFTMTGMTTTITLSVGKNKGTYTIINYTFAKTPPKKITAENKKIYTNFTDDAGKQDICYNFSSAIEGMHSFRLQTTNKTLLPLIDSIDADRVSDESLKLTISPKVSRGLKAGSYTIAVEPLDGSGNALCKPFNITLKLENLKKSFKVKNSYTMSYKDATAVPLEVTSYAGLSSSGAAPVLLDDNIKGQYNKITDILEIGKDHNIRLKDGKKFADKVTSMTGYIKYTVYWLDGTKEDRLEKITVKMSDKPVLKLRTPDFVRYYYEAGMEDPYSDLPVFDSKTYTWVKIAKVAVFDSKTEELLKEGTVKLQEDGKLKFTVMPKGTGKVTLKLNVIPEASIYKNDPITKDNSIPITVTINYKKW